MSPELLSLASELAARGEGFALVTVVRREPPSSARVGDAALVTAGGEVHGWVGGGCTRSTLLREALRSLADGEPRLLSVSPDPARERRPGLVALQMTCKSGGTVDLYVEPVLPGLRLVVFGVTPVARALVRIAQAMGYRVDVIDAEADGASVPGATRVVHAASEDALPHGAYVLVATMDEGDLEAIEAAVSLSPAYLGVIASRKRFAELHEVLAARGVSRAALELIAAPAGLDIGARTPEEIALSVMAQIIEQRRRPGRNAPQANDATPTRAPREAVDPVCGMTVAVAGARHQAEAESRKYYFCCAGCREKFLADPARYASAGAGARHS